MRFTEEDYDDYLDLKYEYLELISKENLSIDETFRFMEIGMSFYSRFHLNETDVLLEKRLYPVIDYDRLYNDIIDEFGLSKSIIYYDILNDPPQSFPEIEKVIRENHTYVTNNINDLIRDYGNHYGLNSSVITPEEFLEYISALGFIMP